MSVGVDKDGPVVASRATPASAARDFMASLARASAGRWVVLPDAVTVCFQKVWERTQRHHAALRRFRRALKRHERRALRFGLRQVAETIRAVRDGWGWPYESNLREGAADSRRMGGAHATEAWLYERVADALVRLRSDLAAAEAR